MNQLQQARFRKKKNHEDGTTRFFSPFLKQDIRVFSISASGYGRRRETPPIIF